MRVAGDGKTRSEVAGKLRGETSPGSPVVGFLPPDGGRSKVRVETSPGSPVVGFRPRQAAECPHCHSRQTRMVSGGAATKATAASDSIVRYFGCHNCNHRWPAPVPLV